MGNESGCLHAADFFVDANYCAFITLSALQGCRAAPLTTCCRLVPPCPPLPRVPPPVLLLPPRPPPGSRSLCLRCQKVTLSVSGDC